MRRGRRRTIFLVLIAALIVVRIVILAASGAGVALIVVVVALVVAVRVPRVRARIKAVFSAVIVGLARVLARPLAWRGITGRLARDNTIRHPGRTAVTAMALMIGLALVSLISVLAAGTKASINQAIDASFAGNLIITNSATAGNAGIPTEIPAAIRHIPGVE